MTPPAGSEPEDGPRRRLIVAGTRFYHHYPELAGVPRELDKVTAVFERLGFVREARLDDPTSRELETWLTDWAYGDDHGDDVVVFYYTGHGHDASRDGEGDDRHYLLCRDTNLLEPLRAARPTAEITRALLHSRARSVMLIIDACYAGQGGFDARTVARSMARSFGGADPRNGTDIVDLVVIAVAGAAEEARPMAFADALEAALDQYSVSRCQEHLTVEQVVDKVNEVFQDKGIPQRAWCSLESGGSRYFFKNSGYRPEALAGDLDLAEQEAWLSPEGQRRKADLEAHFAPRAHGFVDASDRGRGSYFVGRTEEIAELTAWLRRTDDKDADPRRAEGRSRGIVVTGGPGVGKSALLGRLVLHSRRTPALSGQPVIHTWIHARHRFLPDIVRGIADAAGVTVETPQALLAAIARRKEPLHILIDALDEAGPADGGDSQAELIARTLLAPLTRIPCVRLLVGARPHVLRHLEPHLRVLNLDGARARTRGDIAAYARRLLVAPDGPGSTGPYDGETAAAVADEIAGRVNGSFLNARLAARELGHRKEPIDIGQDHWRELVPQPGETPGRTFLRTLDRQLGEHAARGRALLTALALAEGAGLPPDHVWRALASAVDGSGTTPGESAFGWQDLRWILDVAREHIVEELDPSSRQSVYRLYHESYAEALVAGLGAESRARAARALLHLVPQPPGHAGRRDWDAAPPYVLRHLATHAAGTDLLDELAVDPAYLLSADHGALQRALNGADTEPARAAGRALGRCAATLRTRGDRAESAAYLRLAALQSDATQLAEAVRRVWPSLPWDAEWARVSPLPYRTIGSFEGRLPVTAVARVHGRRALVTADDSGAARIWDGEDGELLTELPVGFGTVHSAHGCWEGRAPWVGLRTQDGDLGQLWVYDLETRDLVGCVSLRDWADAELVSVDGECVAVLLDRAGNVRVVRVEDEHVLASATGWLSRGPAPWPLSLWRRSAVRLAAGMVGDRLAVAVVVERERDLPLRGRARLTAWEFRPRDDWSAHFQGTVRLRGRLVAGLSVCQETVCVACPAPKRSTGTRDHRLGALRLVEWTGLGEHTAEAAAAVCFVPAPQGGDTPLCLSADEGAVTVRDSEGGPAGRGRTDAPVWSLLPLWADDAGVEVLSLSRFPFSAKAWRIAYAQDVGVTDRPPDEAQFFKAGAGEEGPVVVTRIGRALYLLDGVTGRVVDSFDDPRRSHRVTAGRGAPVLRRAAGRGDAVHWTGGTEETYPGLLRKCYPLATGRCDDVPYVVVGTGLLPRLEARRLTGERVGARSMLLETRRFRVVGGPGCLLVSYIGHVDGIDDGDGYPIVPPEDRLEVKSVVGKDYRWSLRLDNTDVLYDIGVWPDGPVVGLVGRSGRLTVHHLKGSRDSDEETVRRPDTARPVVLRLQTRHGLPTVLTITSDWALTLFRADTGDVLHQLALGFQVEDADWIDDDLLCVRTTTGLLCLRLA
ncbi:caspase family protein [Streptomyces coeruleoprunus]|uniref:Caspase family protein n=1 Tax=Streptomyces coeruleoprunus TaxID=285563 RepID=A0ABV9XB51_9ACTN